MIKQLCVIIFLFFHLITMNMDVSQSLVAGGRYPSFCLTRRWVGSGLDESEYLETSIPKLGFEPTQYICKIDCGLREYQSFSYLRFCPDLRKAFLASAITRVEDDLKIFSIDGVHIEEHYQFHVCGARVCKRICEKKGIQDAIHARYLVVREQCIKERMIRPTLLIRGKMSMASIFATLPIELILCIAHAYFDATNIKKFFK